MARETKVGLLAGLAFIICFAVILANRGRQEGFPAIDAARLAEANSPPISRLATNDSVAVKSPRTDRSIVSPRLQPPPVATTASNSGELTPTGVPVNTGSLDAEQFAFGSPQRSAPNPATVTTPAPMSSLAAPGVEKASAAGDAASRVTSIEEFMRDTQRKAAAGPAEVLPTGSNRSYMVMPGDTLWKITSAQYGAATGARVSAILELNRSQLKSAEQLRAGMKLVLPDLPHRGGVADSVVGLAGGSPDVRSDGGSTMKVAGGSSTDAIGAHSLSSGGAANPAAKEASLSGKGKPLVKATLASSKVADGTNSGSARKGGKDGGKDKEIRVEKESTRSDRREAGGRSYQVKSGDSFASIARDQLGDVSRWREIQRLNRGRVANPEALRVGAQVMLPFVQSSKGSRR